MLGTSVKEKTSFFLFEIVISGSKRLCFSASLDLACEVPNFKKIGTSNTLVDTFCLTFQNLFPCETEIILQNVSWHWDCLHLWVCFHCHPFVILVAFGASRHCCDSRPSRSFGQGQDTDLLHYHLCGLQLKI